MSKVVKVLLVDDNPALLAILQRASQGSFPEATFSQVYTAAQAIAYIEEAGNDSPALVLLSVEFKNNVSGFNFLAFLKTWPILFPVRVSMFSNTPSVQDIIDAFEFGATSCFVKPHNAAEWSRYLAMIRLHYL